ELLQRLDLQQVGVTAEVQIGQVNYSDRGTPGAAGRGAASGALPYHVARIRYLSVCDPSAGTRTTNSARVLETRSAGTVLEVISQSPPRDSTTVTEAALSVAFVSVTSYSAVTIVRVAPRPIGSCCIS